MNIGTLYLVATPIGNLGDFSPRARQIMCDVDFIAAEDTRVTKKLLNALDLPSKPMISYFEHNRRERGEEIVKKLLGGENCALVTDAGTPAISDPGEDLVALCAENNIPVQSIPGCCAAVCALAVSGLPTGRWCFEGFLSVNKKARKEHLDSLLSEKRTMIFYEAPHKLRQTLHDMRLAFGDDRKIAMCREITKIHEESLRMTLSEAEEYYTENSPRGEYVLVLEGNTETITDVSDEERMEIAISAVQKRIESGETLKDAVKLVSADIGVKKNALYKEALNRLS
ncbi:MAG TPA: 16S rRNA (cytidine(1402)-2'-O)-methyltransferase [Candidatus Butyricicoccus avistercoris]|uniref:Ribosomal RNA small subunit methyltransferase I n=1 Tax=Candidatus Butyricicoccus avistercoris TaxID=2838518 RepID=A0A9D1PH92_9FIRM|nr:16S rRNA (cytidine(1402)-2'-O)-methyltransferase [Candidatus Butyricicoccus avistercoris]